MASYPTSVKSYTTKSDGAGNKIFAAHINDLQDEVTAIEDGLLNGTAPVNGSRVTAPALQVASGSTLNTLQVSGNSSFVAAPMFSTGFLERGRGVRAGEWSTFTATFAPSAGSVHSTNGAGSQITMEYTVIGRTLILNFTTVSTLTAVSTAITFGLPSTFTATRQVVNSIRLTDNNVDTLGIAFTTANSTTVTVRKNGSGNISSGSLAIQGLLMFQVNG